MQLQKFEAYNSCIQWSLGKLQGQGVTHFGGFVWRRILMEDCVTFSLYFEDICEKYTKNRLHNLKDSYVGLCNICFVSSGFSSIGILQIV